MVERNVGQMSLADGLVEAPRGGILDDIGDEFCTGDRTRCRMISRS